MHLFRTHTYTFIASHTNTKISPTCSLTCIISYIIRRFITVVTMFLLGLPVDMKDLQLALDLVSPQPPTDPSKCSSSSSSSSSSSDYEAKRTPTSASTGYPHKNPQTKKLISWLQACHLIYPVEGANWISLLQISPVDVPNYPQIYSESAPQV